MSSPRHFTQLYMAAGLPHAIRQYRGPIRAQLPRTQLYEKPGGRPAGPRKQFDALEAVRTVLQDRIHGRARPVSETIGTALENAPGSSRNTPRCICSNADEMTTIVRFGGHISVEKKLRY